MIELQIKGCKVHLHFSIFALAAFSALFAGAENGVLLLAFILMHETAHLLAMLFCGISPKSVIISALGMRILLHPAQRPKYQESACISLAGPLSNLAIGALCILFHAETAMQINFCIGFFHLLPLEPLDGGLALRALLSAVFEKEKADRISTVVSFTVVFPLMVLGFLLLIYTRNFSLLLVALYAMLYLLLRNGKFEL